MSTWEPHGDDEYRCTVCECVFANDEPGCACDPDSLAPPSSGEVESEFRDADVSEATLYGAVPDRVTVAEEAIEELLLEKDGISQGKLNRYNAIRQFLGLIHDMQRESRLEARVQKIERGLKAIETGRAGGDLIEPPQDSTAVRN